MISKLADLIVIRNFLSQALNDMSIRLDGPEYRLLNSRLSELNLLFLKTSLHTDFVKELKNNTEQEAAPVGQKEEEKEVKVRPVKKLERIEKAAKIIE